MEYFKREELTHNRDKQFPLTDEQESNLKALMSVLNKVREAYGRPMLISSGYRPAAINASVGGAKKSNHLMCLAADIADKNGSFTEWVMENLDKVKECGVEAIEDPRYTLTVNKDNVRISGWIHLQIIPVKSGTFVFVPYSGPIKLKVEG